jgi:hypothetical protein
MDPKNCLEECGKSLTHTGIRSPDCSARSESLYRLGYPGPKNVHLSVAQQPNLGLDLIIVEISNITHTTTSCRTSLNE